MRDIQCKVSWCPGLGCPPSPFPLVLDLFFILYKFFLSLKQLKPITTQTYPQFLLSTIPSIQYSGARKLALNRYGRINLLLKVFPLENRIKHFSPVVSLVPRQWLLPLYNILVSFFGMCISPYKISICSSLKTITLA